MSNDDFVFLDNFIKTYFPEASKTLKNVLTQEALKKVCLPNFFSRVKIIGLSRNRI